MDAYEATKVVFARVQGLVDADLASKIMGMLLTQDKSEEDMIRLAFGPEHLLQSVVADLAACSKPPSPPAPAWRMAPGAAGGDAEGGLPFGAASEAFYPGVRVLITDTCSFRAADMLFAGGDDMHRFSHRSPRMDRGDLSINHGARQIYLTFPADSTFTEEDVSSYFSYLRKAFDELVLPLPGQRMLYGSMAGHEAAFLRRRLEEQQEAAELQHAIELQGRRLMGLQFLDLKNRGHHLLGSPVGSPSDGNGGCFSGNGNGVHLDDAISTIQDNSNLSSGLFMGPYAAASVISKEGKQEYQEEGGDGNGNGNGSPKLAVNSGEEGRRESGPGAAAASNVVCEYQESGMEHNHHLPGSPFASPTKEASIAAAAAAEQQTAHTGAMGNSSSPHLVASSLFPPTKPLYSSCFSQVPR
uniref:AtC3H46-like PABC-like domain-containing protein n=1 Tax=Aegilops tauschii TaxID=37682 RepID=R7WGI6_AEGTA